MTRNHLDTISEFSCYNRTCLADLTPEFENAFSNIKKKLIGITLGVNTRLGITDSVFIFCKHCNHSLEFTVKLCPSDTALTIVGCGSVVNKNHCRPKTLSKIT